MTAAARPALSRRVALLCFVAMTLIWGSTWFAIHVQLNGTPPFVSISLRFALAAAALGLWMAASGRGFRIERRHWPLVPLQAATLYGINYLFAYSSSQYIASGLVALVFALNVVFALLLEPWLLGRRSPPLTWFAALLGVAGLALVLAPDIELPGSRLLWGAGLALGGALTVGFGNVLSARMMSGGVPLAAMNFYGFCGGSAIALAAAAASGDGFAVVWSPAYLWSLGYLALVGSVLAFALFLRAVQDLGPVRAAYSSVLTPIIALLISGALEGWRATPAMLFGVALVLAGNGLILLGRQPRTVPAAAD